MIEPDPDEVAKAAALLAGAQRPVIIAGSDVYAGDAVAALREAAEALQIPVFTNGMGRGSAAARAPARLRQGPPGRARAAPTWSPSIGTPLDFRLGFGDFGDAQVVHIVDAPTPAGRPRHRRPSRRPATCG